MVSANPKSRPKPSDLLSLLREHGGYLATHHVSIALRIEELQVKLFNGIELLLMRLWNDWECFDVVSSMSGMLYCHVSRSWSLPRGMNSSLS